MKSTSSSYSLRTMLSFGGLMALLLGGAVAMFLASRSADIRQQAMSIPSCYAQGCISGFYCSAPGAYPVQDPSRCGGQTNVNLTVKSCGAKVNVFTEVPKNTVTCGMNGLAYYECKTGFTKVGSDCVPNPMPAPSYRPTSVPSYRPYPTTVPSYRPTPSPVSSSCRSSVGLFQGQVTNSSQCFLNGATYYECNVGYTNYNYGCVSSQPSPVPSYRPTSVPSYRPYPTAAPTSRAVPIQSSQPQYR